MSSSLDVSKISACHASPPAGSSGFDGVARAAAGSALLVASARRRAAGSVVVLDLRAAPRRARSARSQTSAAAMRSQRDLLLARRRAARPSRPSSRSSTSGPGTWSSSARWPKAGRNRAASAVGSASGSARLSAKMRSGSGGSSPRDGLPATASAIRSNSSNRRGIVSPDGIEVDRVVRPVAQEQEAQQRRRQQRGDLVRRRPLALATCSSCGRRCSGTRTGC